jgi:hypothetical protein
MLRVRICSTASIGVNFLQSKIGLFFDISTIFLAFFYANLGCIASPVLLPSTRGHALAIRKCIKLFQSKLNLLGLQLRRDAVYSVHEENRKLSETRE